MSNILATLRREFDELFGDQRLRVNEPLAKHCNWRVGGPADLFLIVRSADELIQAVTLAQQHTVPRTILGFGANVLVSDKGIRGLVILNRAHRIAVLEGCSVEADSGTNLAVLAKEAAQEGVAGLEFLIGIPGTVGAAVAVNAGTRTTWISSLIKEVRLLSSNGQADWRDASELDFSYRNSKLKETGEVVITAKLQGEHGSPAEIARRMSQELQVRKTQPTGPSAGSVFTNPPGDFAGRLIEQSGLKGYQVGGAKISEMHANFILNVGGAKARDVRNVIERAKAVAADRFGVQLEEEIRYLGEW